MCLDSRMKAAPQGQAQPAARVVAIFRAARPPKEGAPDLEAQPDEQIRARYRAALLRLRKAGIEITADEQAGADAYIACRAQWDHHIKNLAPSMAYSMEEIDVALSSLGLNPADPR